MERNMACDNEDSTKPVCAADGSGGCVACDDGRGNYQPSKEEQDLRDATKSIFGDLVQMHKITPKDRLADALHTAWHSYIKLFGEQPHGTLPQMKALVALIPENFIGEAAKPGITIDPKADWWSCENCCSRTQPHMTECRYCGKPKGFKSKVKP